MLPLFADLDPLATAGAAGGIVTIAGLIGGAVVWFVSYRKGLRSDSIVEWQQLLKEQKAMAQAVSDRQESRIKDLEGQKKSYKEMAEEAIEVSEREVNAKRSSEGKKPFPPIANVVAEHHSPVTIEQQEAADLQTARARITAVKVALDLPPRQAGEPETDEQRADRLAKEKTTPASDNNLSLMSLLKVKEAIAAVPEKTAAIVVEKLKEET